MRDREVTFKELHERTGYSVGWLHGLAAGERSPSVESMRVVAAAFDVDPMTFAEYAAWSCGEEARGLAMKVGAGRVMAALASLE